MKSKDNHRETYRRNLSSLYIFDTLPQDKGKRFPTCIEDCNEKTRMETLFRKSPEWLKNCGQHLNETFLQVWRMLKKSETEQILCLTGGRKPYCETAVGDKELPYEINRFCKIMRFVAGMADIYAPGSEAAMQKPKSEIEDEE